MKPEWRGKLTVYLAISSLENLVKMSGLIMAGQIILTEDNFKNSALVVFLIAGFLLQLFVTYKAYKNQDISNEKKNEI